MGSWEGRFRMKVHWEEQEFRVVTASHWLSVAVCHWLRCCWVRRKSFFLLLGYVKVSFFSLEKKGTFPPAGACQRWWVVVHEISLPRASRLNLSEISCPRFHISSFTSRSFLKSIANQELDFLHLVVLFLSARKDLSGLSYPMSEGECRLENVEAIFE